MSKHTPKDRATEHSLCTSHSLQLFDSDMGLLSGQSGKLMSCLMLHCASCQVHGPLICFVLMSQIAHLEIWWCGFLILRDGASDGHFTVASYKAYRRGQMTWPLRMRPAKGDTSRLYILKCTATQIYELSSGPTQ